MNDRVIEIDVSIENKFVYEPEGDWEQDTPFGCKLKIILRGLEGYPHISPAFHVRYKGGE